MGTVTAGGSQVLALDSADLDRLTVLPVELLDQADDENAPGTNAALLLDALNAAIDAQQAGVLGGPPFLNSGQFEIYFRALGLAEMVDAAELRAASRDAVREVAA